MGHVRELGLVGTVLLAIATVAEAGKGDPVPLEDGRIQHGAYLVFGDHLGGLNVMKGSEIVVRRAGINCGGEAGFFPFDRFPERNVDLREGGFTVRCAIPAAGIAYEQEVSIVGDRIRIRLRRHGEWEGNAWEGWFFELPFRYFRGARVRADGEVIELPGTYSEERRSIVSSAKLLECHVDDPALNLVVECEAGINLSDRRHWRDLKFLLSVSPPRRSGDHVDVFLTLPDVPAEDVTAVRYSRLGYPAKGEKLVALEWPRHLPRPAKDEVRLERGRSTVVAKGRFGPTVAPEHMQADFALFDFSVVEKPGDYLIVWSGGEVQFPIRRELFTDRLWEPTLDCYLPFQMCHAEVDLGRKVTGHPACHLDDGIRVPADFPGTDGFRSYGCEGTKYEAGDAIPCAMGGWHDAGDCDLNIYAQGFLVYQLALAYEEFGIDRDVATLDVKKRRFVAGRKDGVPDLVQQIEWGALWLLSMMQAGGRSFVGVVAQPHLRQQPGGWDQSTDNQPGTGDERHVYVDHHSELLGMQAMALCAASRVLARERPKLATRCLEHAERAWKYFATHDEVYRATAYFYPRTIGRDGHVAATLAELYLTTRNRKYLRELEGMAGRIANLDMTWPAKQQSSGSSFWYCPPVLARLVPKLREGELRDACLSVCERAADHLEARLGGRPWAGHYTDFGKLGGAGEPPGRVYDAYWISQVLPERGLMDRAVIPMLWLFGLHPIGDEVFVSGVGFDGPQHMHSGHLFHVFAPEGGIVPGVLVPGHTTIRHYWPRDNALYYFDDGNVANCESTIGDVGNYLFAIHAMQAAGY